ncbi:hypothetical protein SAY87_002993 [Trapa incisa]|uniref:Uncharacterized protein n=1 Tax=Trapa incisa TaxID=236973 RepID=A0AAN7QH67_9MYRT|nr:hypothetical protein SAY87_002993 [Trapa incisa]
MVEALHCMSLLGKELKLFYLGKPPYARVCIPNKKAIWDVVTSPEYFIIVPALVWQDVHFFLPPSPYHLDDAVAFYWHGSIYNIYFQLNAQSSRMLKLTYRSLIYILYTQEIQHNLRC